MRKLIVVVSLATLPSLAQAKRAKYDPRLTYVDDEPISTSKVMPQSSHRPIDLLSTGSRMNATGMRAPQVSHVSTGEATSHAPTPAEPTRAQPEAASGGAFDELVARHMRKNLASIESCAAEATRRRPSASGTVELAVVVAEKRIESVHVASDSVHDIELDACLVRAGLGWKLQLASARFTWPVTLSPSASR